MLAGILLRLRRPGLLLCLDMPRLLRENTLPPSPAFSVTCSGKKLSTTSHATCSTSRGGHDVPVNGTCRGTILVADDNEGIREPLVQLLRLQGYSVIAVADGEQAFTEMCSQPVDLALLDVMMPGRTGFSVCRAVKSRPETRFVPVVLITGLSKGEDRIQGIEAGADDFLNKPVKKEELLARVNSLLRLKRFTDELENAETVLCSLARSIEAKDPYTEGH